MTDPTTNHTSAQRTSKPSLLAPVLMAAVVLAACVALFFVLSRRPSDSGPPPSINAELASYLESLSIQPFELTDQGENAVTQDVFKGKHTILSFIFTHCQMACPVMFSNLLQIQDKLAGLPVQFVAISVDPVHDTPQRLSQHIEELGLDPARWTLLTGDDKTIKRIVTDDLKFALRDDPLNPIPLSDGSRMSNIVHPTKLLLIDPEGRFIGLYSGMNPEEVDTLVTDVRFIVSRQDR